MKSWNYLFFIVQILSFSLSFAQSPGMEISWYKFKRVNGYDSNFSYTMNFIRKDNYKLFSEYKIPEDLVKQNSYRIRPIILQWDQFYYSKYKAGKLTKEQLIKIVPWMDTTMLLHAELNNYLPVLIYTTPGYKHLIFDMNNDFDFTNDTMFSYSLQHIKNQSSEKWEQQYISIKRDFEFVVNRKINIQQAEFFVFPFKSPNLNIAEIDEFFFEHSDPVKLYETNGPENMTLYFVKNIRDSIRYSQIKIVNEDGSIRDKNYKQGDKFSYFEKNYVLDSINKNLNAISIRKLDTLDILLATGREENLYFSNHITGINQQGKPVATNTYNKKYLLLDFWATWCVPCKESLPILAEIYQKYKDDNFSLLSISVDDPSATQKVKQFIKTHNMNWDVMMPSKKVKMKSSGFAEGGIPKFVLLNPEGRIIKIANGLFELPEMQSKLKSIFQGNK